MKKSILALFILVSISIPFNSYAETCREIFDGNEAAYEIGASDLGMPRSLWSKMKDVKILAFPKLGFPSYRSPHYDISLIGNPKKATYDPSLVLAKARELIDSYLVALRSQGLESKHRSHFVIEVSPGGLGDREGKIGFLNQEFGGPFTANEGIGLMIEGFAGTRRRLTSKNFSQIVIIPMDEFGGPRLGRFVIAHELGHDVFRSKNDSLNEAMADYVAWLLSGQTGFLSSKPVETKVMDAKGNIETVTIPYQREIANPRVSKLSEIRPSVERYHTNSTLFSHLFYKIDQRFGRGKSVSLIRFLEDQVERTPVINDMTTFEENMKVFTDFLNRSLGTTNGFLGSLRMIFLGGGNVRGAINTITASLLGKNRQPHSILLEERGVETEGLAIRKSVEMIALLIREWARDPKNEVSAEEIEKILKDAEI